MNQLAEFLNEYWHLCIIGALLAYSVLGFVRWFLLPARKLKLELDLVLKELTSVQRNAKGRVVDLEEIRTKVMTSPTLAHLWKEYTETLHPQKEVDEFGAEHIVRWRATTLAHTFFNEHAIITSRLWSEFYKHLPGILTGIGILGTFSGLIRGLHDFDAKSPEAMTVSLRTLIGNVKEAFVVSATAISLAMLTTWLEKSLLAARNKQVEELCLLIDSLFEAGAGEEYLARLVAATECSATQTAQMKDSLVSDLRQILSELTNAQVEASAKNNAKLSSDLAQSLTVSFREPMDRISRAIEGVGTDQGQAVHKLLSDVLVNFTTQMQEMFGGQLKGSGDVMAQASQAMQTTAAKFDALSTSLQSAGRGAAEAMSEELTRAIGSIESRQQQMNCQMAEFVQQIKSLVAESQSETNQTLHTLLTELSASVAATVETLKNQSQEAVQDHRNREAAFTEKTTNTVGTMSEEFASLSKELRSTAESIRGSVEILSETTRDSINRMNSGADTLLSATTAFAKAGQGVTTVMQTASQAVERIQVASTNLSGASSGVQQGFEDYKRSREAFAAMISDLKATVENAKREASMTESVVAGIKAAAEHLSAAQGQAGEYLKGVNEVLVQTHQEFATNVENTLRVGNAQFHKELADAVGLLKGAIEDLTVVAESLGEKV